MKPGSYREIFKCISVHLQEMKKKRLDVQSETYNFIRFFQGNLLSANTFQELNCCISLFTARQI